MLALQIRQVKAYLPWASSYAMNNCIYCMQQDILIDCSIK